MKQPFLARIWGNIREFVVGTGSNVLAQVSTFTRWNNLRTPPITNDWGRSDYLFWRRVYYGHAVGLQLSGLLIKPLVSKVAAWSLGRAPQWKCDDQASQDALDSWWEDHHPEIYRAYRSSLKEADAFLVINPDLTITLLPPESVEPIVDPADFGLIIGWRVGMTLQHPQTPERMTMIDEYYVTHRTHEVLLDGRRQSFERFENPLQRMMVIHIGNQVAAGQVFGHPEAEGVINLLQRYGAVFDAAIDGNILQGRPTPVITFAQVADLNKFWQMYGVSETVEMPDGTTKTDTTLAVNLSEILTLTNGTFDYKTPGNFSQDMSQLLEIMFYLFLEYAEIPEFVMGNAISSSKASTETQMPVFEKFIEGKQGETRQWLLQVAEIVLELQSFLQPGVKAQTPSLQWRKISQDGRLTLATLEWAYAEGLLDRRTALMLAPVEVENLDEVLGAAKTEFPTRPTVQLAEQAREDELQQRGSETRTASPLRSDAKKEEAEVAEMWEVAEAAAQYLSE